MIGKASPPVSPAVSSRTNGAGRDSQSFKQTGRRLALADEHIGFRGEHGPLTWIQMAEEDNEDKLHPLLVL
jgi:hypothetical protein